MNLPTTLIEDRPFLDEWAIVIGYRGSIAHGMYLPPKDPKSVDDKDLMVVCVPPPAYYTGLREFGNRGTKEIMQAPWDVVCYECRKFLHLLCKNNPNVLSLLWLRPNLYVKRTEAFDYLLERREVFSSKLAYHAFVGYGRQQRHKMTHTTDLGYMGAKRKALVEEHGYDTKNAAHLIRLLRMGMEFLTDGALQVVRPDAAELLSIKRGEWSLEAVMKEADRLFPALEAAFVGSKLPSRPDFEVASGICEEVIRLARR